MKLLSILLFSVLAVIASIHVYWAFGGLWPSGSIQGLLNTVIGDPRMRSMPPMWMTLIVAGLIFTSGVVALSAGRILSVGPLWLTKFVAVILAFIYVARGLLGIFVNYRGIEQSEPFASYDIMYYSPLCIVIGIGFLILVSRRV